MIFNDEMIIKAINQEKIRILPFNQENLQPNSYDVSLGDEIINANGKRLKLPYVLNHGEFILGTTEEHVWIKKDCCCMIDGKSTTARKGLMIHLTAGFIDCGFKGNITLEMVNFGRPIILKQGMKIGQLVFYDSPTPRKPYNGHYQNQKGVTPAWDVKNSKPWSILKCVGEID